MDIICIISTNYLCKILFYCSYNDRTFIWYNVYYINYRNIYLTDIFNFLLSTNNYDVITDVININIHILVLNKKTTNPIPQHLSNIFSRIVDVSQFTYSDDSENSSILIYFSSTIISKN